MMLKTRSRGMARVAGVAIALSAMAGVSPAEASTASALPPIAVHIVGNIALLTDNRAVIKVDVTCPAGGLFSITPSASQIVYMYRQMASYDGDTVRGTCTGVPQRLGLVIRPTTQPRPGAELFGGYSPLVLVGPESAQYIDISTTAGVRYTWRPSATGSELSGTSGRSIYVDRAAAAMQGYVTAIDYYKSVLGAATFDYYAWAFAMALGRI